MVLQQLHTTSLSQRIMVFVLVMSLVMSGFYLGVWSPMADRLESLRTDLSRLNHEHHHQRGLTTAFVNTRSKVEELKIRIGQKIQYLSLPAAAVDLHQAVSEKAKQYGLEVTEWRPLPLQFSKNRRVRTVPIQLRIEGGYHQFAQFLNHVLASPWVLEVTSLTMEAPVQSDQELVLRTDLRLLSVVAVPEKEQISNFKFQISNKDEYGGADRDTF